VERPVSSSSHGCCKHCPAVALLMGSNSSIGIKKSANSKALLSSQWYFSVSTSTRLHGFSFVMWRKSPTQPHNISLNRVDTPTCQSKPVPLNSFSHGQLEETLGCARVTRLKTIQEERKSKNLFHHKHSNFHRSEYTRLTSMFGIKHC